MPDRIALIVANTEFNDPKLAELVTPTRDAAELAEVLEDPELGSFDVIKLVNETMDVVRRTIGRLYHRRKRDDLLLLYYSGHGLRDDQSELYLATKDTEVEFASSTAVEAAFIRGQLDRSSSRRKIVILDCCHSGAFMKGAKSALGSSAGTQDAFEGTGYGRVILTASNAVQLAWEGDKLIGEAEASVFTRFLLQGLKTGEADQDKDGLVSLDELYKYIYEHVIDASTKQTPQKFVDSVEGQIIIAKNPYLIVKSAKLPLELRAAIESPLVSVRHAVINDLKQLLKGADEGLALAAHQTLIKLVDDDSKKVSAEAMRLLGEGIFKPAAETDAPKMETEGVKEPLVTERASRRERIEIIEPGPIATEIPAKIHIGSPVHIDLLLVPAGEFLMGSNFKKDAYVDEDELPQHWVNVPEFYIGKYPVTNEQYEVFLDATGHDMPLQFPKGFEHPVVTVSWTDARAFCEWLSKEAGQSFRLPTEAEWEKAARGTDGRAYPWGNEWSTGKCNSNERHGTGTTPVGRYSPRGDSPYGVADMAGNVWEWCSSLYMPYPYYPFDGREDLEASEYRVVRGGSFKYDRKVLRCAYRDRNSPGGRGDSIGFRVVASP